MTTLVRDDVSGNLYQNEEGMYAFGLVAYGQAWGAFDVHEDTIREDPDAVAERMHDLVDDWLAERREFNRTQAEADEIVDEGGPVDGE